MSQKKARAERQEKLGEFITRMESRLKMWEEIGGKWYPPVLTPDEVTTLLQQPDLKKFAKKHGINMLSERVMEFARACFIQAVLPGRMYELGMLRKIELQIPKDIGVVATDEILKFWVPVLEEVDRQTFGPKMAKRDAQSL